MNTYTHREPWLNALAERLRTEFKAVGGTLPTNIRITCGFPSKRALLGTKGAVIGQCWYSPSSDDNTHEIMVSPIIADPIRVADVLCHELCHAIAGPEAGHKGQFRKLALAMGLTGKMTATTAGELFIARVKPIIDDLGPYPHAKLNARDGKNSGPKKQGTRMVKCTCPNCGYTVRTTRKWLDEIGEPICPQDRIALEAAA